jgi:hypothetical protein
MKECPEAIDLINQFILTDGKLSLTEIENMEHWKYQAWIVCRNAQAVAREIAAFKSKNTFASVWNKDAYKSRLGLGAG